jgi:hypothetical protein
LGLKTFKNEIKSTVKNLKSDLAEGRISKCDETSFEIIHSDKNIKKCMEQTMKTSIP